MRYRLSATWARFLCAIAYRLPERGFYALSPVGYL